MREDSIIALFQNMHQIKDIGFCGGHQKSIRVLIPYFGHNIRSLNVSDGYYLTLEDLNLINNNTNLVKLRLDYCDYTQQIFDFICDNFTQLKSFGFESFDSISELIKLINLENFELSQIFNENFKFSLMDKNYSLNKLLLRILRNSSKLRTIFMTSFENLVQIFPNIENLSLIFNLVNCELQNNDENKKNDCFNCIFYVFKAIAKLNRLKVLENIYINCDSLKAIGSNKVLRLFQLNNR
jgi:hypothetical protein